jgi:hypothetical protein
VPSSTGDSFPHMIAVARCGQWRLASMPQSIAMPANGCNVRSTVRTAILSRSQVFGGALHLAYLTNANSVRASKFRRITDTHFAAIIAKVPLSHAGLGPKARDSSCHGFVGPS